MTGRQDQRPSRSKSPSHGIDPNEAAGKVIRIMATAMGLAILITMVLAVRPPDPQQIRERVQATHATKETVSRMPNPTERELQKICTARRTHPSENAKAAAAWNGGWEGALGDVASAAGLRFDWKCVVKGHSVSEGFACATREEASPSFQLLPLHMAGNPHIAETFPLGSEIQLQRIRKGLVEDDGVVLSVTNPCHVQVIIDSEHFMKGSPPAALNRDEHEWKTPRPTQSDRVQEEAPDQAL